jgi:pimeloyl-ACP methyl ester carboxylesterase
VRQFPIGPGRCTGKELDVLFPSHMSRAFYILRGLLYVAFAITPFTRCAWGQDDTRLVDVGSHRLFLDCSGGGEAPSVVFEAGSGRTTEDWSSVQEAVGKFARACSYDRAGLGKSDKLPEPQTATEVVDDLHRLLGKANVQGPYVLVGHSQGGIFVRGYTAQYPKEVVGLVLVDSAHEEQFWRVAAISPKWAQRIAGQFSPEEMRRQGFLPSSERLSWHFDIPLIVIEHGAASGNSDTMNEQSEIVFRALQQDLATRSKYGELRKAQTSGHYIQLDQPDLVTQAVEDVIQKARALASSKRSPR